jgi:predicted alpha/beta-fold hydrolase
MLGEGMRNALRPDFFPPFKPRLPWIGGDLQTLRNSLMGVKPTLEPNERIIAPIDAGGLNIAVNHPQAGRGEKALILVHGLGGNETSTYMVSSARYFLALGYRVFRVNCRGVGPSADSSEPPYSAGLTGDLRAVVRRVSQYCPDLPLLLMGYSLGGQLSLRMLGESDVPAALRSCVTVSAPLNLAHAQHKLERLRNTVYVKYVVNNMRKDMAALQHPRIKVSPNKLNSIRDFDEHIIAPAFGFKGADDYYARVSCFDLLLHIDRPTLAIHAEDDPWIPAQDYRDAQWPTQVPAGALLVGSGGHVGFHSRGVDQPWYDSAAQLFFEKKPDF